MINRRTRRRTALLGAGFMSLGIVLHGPAAHAAVPGGPDDKTPPTTQPCRRPPCDKGRPNPGGDPCDPDIARCQDGPRPCPGPRDKAGNCGGDDNGGGGGDRPGGNDGGQRPGGPGGGDIVHGNPTFTG